MAATDLIDTVNENDEIVGNATIQEAREKGLIHRVSRVMVEHPSNKKILLQKRSTKLLWPNCWDNSAAGHVDVDEDYLTAAKRELFEEIGVKAENLEVVGKYFSSEEVNNYQLRRFNMVYRVKIDKTPTKLQKEEVIEVKWFSLDEIKKLIKQHPYKVTDGLRDVINRYYNK